MKVKRKSIKRFSKFKILIISLILIVFVSGLSFAIYKMAVSGRIESNTADTIIHISSNEKNLIVLSPSKMTVNYKFSVDNFKTVNSVIKVNEVVSIYYLKITGLADADVTYKLYYDNSGTKEELSLENSGEYDGYYKSLVQLPITNQISHNYVLSITSNSAITEDKTYSVSIDAGYKQAITPEDYVNPPDLATGMIPIIWDDSTQTWKKANTDSSSSGFNWYNYNMKKWANVATTTNYSTYNSAAVGTEIPYSDIITMFVWIPRFSYRIPVDYYHKTVDESDLASDSENSNLVDVHFSKTESTGGDNWDTNIIVVNSGIESLNSFEAWTTNESFNFGGVYLNGYWVSKFQVSDSIGDSSTANNGIIDNVYILPSKYSKKSISYDNAFTICRNMELSSIYGWPVASNLQTDGTFQTDGNGIDTHLIKNSEWGAIAYLTHSKYGQNKICVNHYPGLNIGNVTGGDESQVNVFTTNVNQSTTGNPYGVYDMSNSIWDAVSAYIGNGSNLNSPVIYNANIKYKDVYSPDSAIDSTWTKDQVYNLFKFTKGAAIWETSTNGNESTTGWFNARSNIGIVEGSTSNLLLSRGGSYKLSSTTLNASIFSFGYAFGGQTSNARSFRPIVAVKTGL